MDYCGILFHNFCSGFWKGQCEVFRTRMPVADGQWWQSLETSAPASCPGVSATPSPAVRVRLFSNGFRCIWVLMCQINNSKTANKCLYIYPLKAVCVFPLPYYFKERFPGEGLFLFVFELRHCFSLPFSFMILLTSKCFFSWKGKDKSGLKTTSSPSLDHENASPSNLEGFFISPD